VTLPCASVYIFDHAGFSPGDGEVYRSVLE
jgi:hypothetical protein